MPRTRPPYPEEFRREAIRLARLGDKPQRRLAKDLGINDVTLRNWLKEEKSSRGDRLSLLDRPESGSPAESAVRATMRDSDQARRCCWCSIIAAADSRSGERFRPLDRWLFDCEDGSVCEQSEPVSVATLKQLLEAFNAHDIDAVMSFFGDDCVLEMPRGPDPWGRRLNGRDQVRQGLASRFAGIPDVHYGADRHWVAGHRGCSEWLLTGTTTDGQRIAVRGCDLFEFRDDKITRKDSYWKIVEA